MSYETSQELRISRMARQRRLLVKALDKKALKILPKFSVSHPERTSAEDFAYARSAGLLFDDAEITHDEAVRWANHERGPYANVSTS